jgi:hypothetical protein
MRTALFWPITQRVMAILGFLTLENGTDWLSRNILKELSLHAAYSPEQRSPKTQFWHYVNRDEA